MLYPPHSISGLVRRLFIILALSVCGLNAVAQTPEEEYHVSKYFTDEFRPMIEADSSVFYRLIPHSEDMFGDMADYDLSFVAFARRGVGYRNRVVMLDGVPLQSGTISLLSRLGLERREVASMAASEGLALYGCGGTTLFSTDFVEPFGARMVGLNFATRGYNAGVRASLNESLGSGWSLSAAIAGRMGEDLHVKGVYTNGLDLGFSLSKIWQGQHKLAFTALFSPSERGMRSISSQEAFRLTGDHYYNPSWGFCSGKVRNANVRRTMLPAAVVSYEARLDRRTELMVSLGAEIGRRGYSALTWFDAQTPMPDNYRYMPSYFASTDVADEVERIWRDCDPKYTQIDWDELCEINRLNGGDAVYAVEERVERVTDICFNASGRTHMGDAVTFRYGVTYSFGRSRNYKQMRDLLGSNRILDIDYYLIDDESFSNNLQNDVRHPNRSVGEGDRYGYDYALTRSEIGINGGVEWRNDRLRFDCGVAVGEASIYRYGYFEKELFSGSRSYGRSRAERFTPYVVKASVEYALSPKQSLGFGAAVCSEAPDGEDLFLQSRYNNRLIDNPIAQTEMSAELNYRLRTKVWTLDAVIFAALSDGGLRVAHYYDDLASTYADMVVSNLSQMRIGAEVAATARFALHWSASLAAVAGYYGYAKDARVSLYADSDNKLLCDNAVAHMGGVRTGNAPQVAISANVAYMNRGWGVRLTGNYAGLRYVEVEPMRRTDRVSRQGSVSEEIFRRFTLQEALPDAITADAAVWKSFRLRGRKQHNYTRLVVNLSVRNLLGSENILYSGRESLRIYRKSIAGEYLYEPFPTRYTYAYPRTYYLSVTYKF